MNKLISILTLFTAITRLSAQTTLHDVYPLDTIIYLAGDFEPFQSHSLAMEINDSRLYISRLDRQGKQMLIRLVQINLNTYEAIYSDFPIKGKESKLFERSRVTAVFTDNDFVFFGLSVYRKSYLIKCSLATRAVVAMTRIDKKTEMAMHYGNNRFCYAYCYNTSDPFMQDSKAYIGIADSNGMIHKNLILTMPGIEFSHFDPRHWIDALPGKMLVAQTLAYDIAVLDSALAETGRIRREVPGWKQMDTAKLREIASSVPRFQAKALIEELEPFHNGKISRVDGAWFINDTSVLVRYYMPVKTPGFMKYEYYYDVWVKKQDTWSIQNQDLTDNDTHLAADAGRMISKQEVPVLGWANPVCMKENTIITLRTMPDVLPYNKTPDQLRKEEASYYKLKNPLLGVCIYKKISR